MKAAVVLCCIVVALADPQFYHVPVNINGLKLNEDVMLDEEQMYAIVTVEDADKFPGYQNSINFHDLKTGYMAMKVTGTGKCRIFQAKQTLAQIKTALKDYQTYGRYRGGVKNYNWDCNQEASTYEKVKEIAGEKVANFCRQYEAQLVKSLPGPRNIRASPMRPSMRTVCVFCSGDCGDGRPPHKPPHEEEDKKRRS